MLLEHEDTFQDNKKSWKKPRTSSFIPSGEDIITEGKCLCGQYIRARLKRAGFLNRKVTQRLRTILDTPATFSTREIFPALNAMGEELERMHPRVYSNVSRQLSRAAFGELQCADTAPFLLHAAAKELFKNEINWGKIISMFAIAGGLAVDIVRQGHYEYLHRLIDGTGDVIEEDLLPWLRDNGSFYGLLDHIRPVVPEQSFLNWFTLCVAIIFVLYIITYIIKTIGSNVYSFLV